MGEFLFVPFVGGGVAAAFLHINLITVGNSVANPAGDVLRCWVKG